uniref:Protein TIC 214 n=1 Tax=Buxus microphylla TaxID=153571 RepID=TI214_BUXMI|nr:hypothetical chloroplast RF1 [Buxus microphylla]A6MM95.1 RecName: Full=Protein TIC 214; AltName: Full=Translocon at the inner envelope membrane of chloroplasts 214; Short=AtTIC214 [Buxus microphylla]ABQ45308.1 hypothetical chloroplast RF1 [Buxus microphylla]WEB60488.1 hypothetical chloroplast RF1 [Buxus sinica var. parvifolia]
MILKSFLLGNLLSLCMKIINSVVVVGLYYGFLTTFSIGPSYLFLLRARVMEEGTEKKVSATTGFITGQLMMFISIYYAPLHLALGRPHTITVLALPYLLFHFFWNNHKHFFDYGSTTRNSMRNLSIQCVFLNNLIFQLFNHFILPSSTLARLVNIYMFRCNNKMLFVTSSFVGWLIGHILFMKWVGLVLFWIRQNHSIKSNVLIRSNKYLVSELRNSMARIFSILLFITCVYYLGRMPAPIVTKKLKETSKTEERGESEEERDVEIETTSETKGTKQEQERSTEEDPSPSLCSEEKEDPDKIDETEEIRVNGKEKTKDEFKETCYKSRPVYENYYLNGNQENSKLEILKDKEDKDLFWFEKPLVTLLFDYKRWNRPLRYIKNDRFENAVRNEMSQYLFYTCKNDGKQRISFTYPPSLSTFLEMIQRKIYLCTKEKLSSEEMYNHWIYTNEQKKNNLRNEFINRIEALDKEFVSLNVLEKITRLCNDETEQECSPKVYDPLLNGPYRGTITNLYSSSIMNETLIEDSIETLCLCINKIHGILLTDYREFEHKINKFDRKSLSRDIGHLSTSIIEFDGESIPSFNFKALSLLTEDGRIDSEDQAKFSKFLVKEISKRVPRWSYKLIDTLEQEERENEEEVAEDHEIRSRKAKRVVIFNDNGQNTDTHTNTSNDDQGNEVALIRYSQQSDFRRDIIKGSMRAQRRKIVTWKLFQANVHSPLFLDRIDKTFFFSFDISGMMKIIFRNWMVKNTELKISDYEEEEKNKKETEKKNEKKREEKTRILIAETWDSILCAQVIRGSMLVIQSIIRKYIVLPSLIIAKNISRMLLFQFPEWSEDLKDWSREIHVKCTYNGVQLSETEFPKNWLIDGIQIKILFPFCLKPWHRSKLGSHHRDPMKNKRKKNDFCFLTVWGMEAELPFGSPRKRLSFFEPICKELEKKIRKVKKNYFIVLKILKERTKLFIKVSKEKKGWVIKRVLFIKRIIKELNKILFGLREVYDSSENKNRKDYIISNQMIHESSIRIRSMDWTNSLLTEKKMKDLTDRTNTIRKKIERIKRDKKKTFLTSEIKISPNERSCDNKKLESPKNIWQILKRRNTRLIRKWNYFIKFLIERIYIDALPYIINIPRIHGRLFLESKKKIMDKSIYNHEKNQEGIDETNKNTTHFISTIKRPLSNNNNKNSKIFCDLSSLSQAYVFYKLSQTQVINKYNLRSVLQYHGASLFPKERIRYFCGTRGIFNSQSKHKRLRNFGMNEWKNWLRDHYQYDLSQIKWSRLVLQKWRNRVNQRRTVQNKDSKKLGSYEKDQLIHYETEHDYEVYSLPSQKENLKKNYRYDLLSYNYIHYENKKGSYIHVSPLQVTKGREIPYNYNIHKPEFFYVLGGIPISDYLGEDYIIDTEENPDRKYFDWIILNFCLRKKLDIEAWTDIDTGDSINKNTKTGTNNYQIIDKIDKKYLFYLTIHQEINPSNQKKNFFDWMGMNEEILNRTISNLELWFFQEFVLLYNAYKIKPWVIPIKLLLLNFNRNKNVSENKNINKKQKNDLWIPFTEKKSIELENRNQEEKETRGQGDLGSDAQNHGNLGYVLSNQQKDVEEDYAGSNIKKRRKKKQCTSNTEAELNFLLKRYLLFQLRWDDPFNQRMINNIKVYCLLLRLINPKEISISSIQSGEMSPDIIQKDLTITELIKKGLLIIEPVRLSIKRDGQFIMYQTISISLVHKNKQQTNGRCREKRYVDKNYFDESIARHEKMVGTGDENHYELLVPENISSPRRRRELRIRICFNSGNKNFVDRNPVFFNENKVKHCGRFLDENKHLDTDKKKLIKLKCFLWPNYQLEDLACMNRYWFNTNNGSRFSMSRIHMYPRLKIR